MTEIYADVAKFQALLDSSYPRKFVMFRLVNEYGNIDPHAAANIATAIAMRRRGQLVNFGGYVNPGHIANSTMLAKIRELGFPTDAMIMLDVERWPNDKGVALISGDHSVGLNSLANTLRTRQQGRADLITGYANRGDLAALWPHRPSWLGLVIAGYNTNDPRDEYANCAAWQYTNGVENHTAWPSASSPFGHCDHNALFVPIPDPVVGTHYDTLEDDMPTAKELWDYALDPDVPMTAAARVLDIERDISGLQTNVAKLLASQAALVALVTNAGGLDQATAQAIADAAAEKAVDGITVTVHG
jgi:hypothetical protein